MSIYFCDLNGTAVTRLSLTIPMFGLFFADIDLDSVPAAAPAGISVLTLAGTPYAVTPIRTTDFGGVRSLRCVGGRGGWRKPVTPTQYANPVSLATLTTDAALAVGELPPVIAPTLPPTRAGYVRGFGAASRVLFDVLGTAWWLDGAGVVQTAPRPPTPVLSPFEIVRHNGSLGTYDVATESPGDWLPGALFASVAASGTVDSVRHALAGSTLRTIVTVSS